MSRTSMPFRFWDKVLVGDGCWEWTASKNGRGYGKFGRGGRSGGLVTAHRMAWELWHGEIPAGLLVCHHCDNPGCVRPDHLFLGTQKDNLADMQSKGRPNRWGARTHCLQGHPYGPSNGKRRTCSTCELMRQKAWRRRLRFCNRCKRYKPHDHEHFRDAGSTA